VSLLRSPKATDVTQYVLNRFLAGTSEIVFRVPVRTHSSSHSASTPSTTRPASHQKEIAGFYPGSVKLTTHLYPVPILKCVESYLQFPIRLMVRCILQHNDNFTLNFYNIFICISHYCSLPDVHIVQIFMFIPTFRMNLMP